MNKLLLSLGLLAVLAAPAAAGRLDDVDPLVREKLQPQAAQQADIDYTSTRSIQSTLAPTAQDDHFDKQRGDQGAYFGANGR